MLRLRSLLIAAAAAAVGAAPYLLWQATRGWPELDLARSRFFRGCRRAATVDNGLGLDNDEQGDPVLLCSGTTLPWQQLWPALRHYD